MGRGRVVVALAFAMTACGPRREAPPVPARAASPAGTVAGERVEVPADDATAPGKLAAIAVTEDNRALFIDEGGVATMGVSASLREAPTMRLPFSEPVSSVVFVRHVAEQARPGANAGVLVCARTRRTAAECVAAYRGFAYRFRLPIENVTHVARFVAGDGGVCVASATTASCWSFNWDGKTATRYTYGADEARELATHLPRDVAASWAKNDERADVEHAVAIAISDDRDDARIVGVDASIAVRCAIAPSGTLSCFGPGVYGELGDGKLRIETRASRPLGDAAVSAVSIHRHRVCGALGDGRVACWGDLPSKNARLLRMCPPDRRASEARFAEAQRQSRARARGCAESCKVHPAQDCFLNCSEQCVEAVLSFRHDEVCQEPFLSAITGGCFTHAEPVRWPSDDDLRDQVREVQLSLSPVFLEQVKDAAGVSVWGHDVCVLHRAGTVTCLTL
jgi:hypothetical protein